MRYLLIVLIVIVLAGVTLKKVWPQYDTDMNSSASSSDKFEVVYTQQVGQLGNLQVILDKETKVKYLYYKFGFGAGLTQLVEKSADKTAAK